MTQQASTLIQQAKTLSTEDQLTIIAQLAQNIKEISTETKNGITVDEQETNQETESQEGSESTLTDSYPSILKIVDSFIENMPDEVLAQLPKDGAEQHDHYIYGIPKRQT